VNHSPACNLNNFTSSRNQYVPIIFGESVQLGVLSVADCESVANYKIKGLNYFSSGFLKNPVAGRREGAGSVRLLLGEAFHEVVMARDGAVRGHAK
jgi:hypothetical protein